MRYARLDELENLLDVCYARVDPDFMRELLHKASISEKPYRDQQLAELLGNKFVPRTKISRGIYGIYTGKRSISFRKFLRLLEVTNTAWENTEGKLLYLEGKSRGGRICPQITVPLGRELGSIVGHILGDGSISQVGHAAFHNTDKVLLNEFLEHMRNLFGAEARIWIQEKKGFEQKKWIRRVEETRKAPDGFPVTLYYPKIATHLLYGLVGIFAKGKTKTIPALCFREGNDEFNAGMLRALYDDEGSVVPSSYTIGICQNDPKLLEDVRNLLFGFGIKPNPLQGLLRRGKMRHWFTITGLKNFIEYREKIGFSSLKKMRRLDELISKVSGSNYRRLRVGESKAEILDILRSKMPMTTMQIRDALRAKEFHVRWMTDTIRFKLRSLEKAGKVRTCGRIGNKTYVWTSAL